MKYNECIHLCGILKPPNLLVNKPRTCIFVDIVLVLPLYIIICNIPIFFAGFFFHWIIQTFKTI